MSSARPLAASTARRTVVAVCAGVVTAGLAFGITAPAQAYGTPSSTTAGSAAAFPENAPVAVDAFQRTATGGWGSATTGGAWTTAGGVASDYTVADGTASMNIRGAGWKLTSALPAATSTDAEVQARLSLDKKPVGGNVDVDLFGRAIDATQGYLLRSKVITDGSVRSSLVKVEGKTATTLATLTQAGLGYTGGDQLQVRLQVTGTGTTTLRAKVWTAGTAEPADWQLSATDTTATLQVPGGLAVAGYTAGGVTSLPIAVQASDVWSGPTAAARSLTAPAEPGAVVPDATSTGVPNGTALTVHEGDLVLSTPGQVVDGLDVRGFVKVTAPDVTIKNSVVRGRATSKQTALVTSATAGASVTIEDSELYAADPSSWIDGVRGYGFTVRRVNLHDVIDMAHIYGDNVTIESSYLHDNLHYEVDPAQNNTPSHDDSIQIQKGTNIRIVGNNISGAFNTGIQLTQDQGIVSNVTVDKNLLDGGGCTVNLAEKGKGAFQGITLTNNTFGRTTKHENCAIISPTTTKPVTANNLFVDGAVASVRKG